MRNDILKIGIEKELDTKITVIRDINRILIYSAMKIQANAFLLYSVLNPETNSLSPSAKSKGLRLVSASIVVNQIKEIIGEIRIMFHLV